MVIKTDESLQISHTSLIKTQTFGCVFIFMLLLSIGFLIYLTLNWMWDEQRLPLSKIVLKGDLQYVSVQAVQKSLAQLEHIGTFMSQDIDELQASVQGIPWVSHASVRKQWPDTIKVFLTEYKAAAIWNGNSFLDEYGTVFNGNADQLNLDEYIKLYGPDGSSLDVLTMWNEMKLKFSPLGLAISSLVLNERRAWQIILDNGIRLELGKESLDERIDRFIFLYKDLANSIERISYIDLRYDIGAAVGWLPEQGLTQESEHD